jgi:2-polyprenyl-6-hydroxyphenyl methylase/3-demethylubiquinone-9 3-methyltransferase
MVIADNVDPAALRHFEAQAALWWDREGEFAALHDINPLRVDYVARRVPLEACRVLDVGCGGGLLSEALASRGARVTGIDLGEAALAAARAHAAAGGLAAARRRPWRPPPRGASMRLPAWNCWNMCRTRHPS